MLRLSSVLSVLCCLLAGPLVWATDIPEDLVLLSPEVTQLRASGARFDRRANITRYRLLSLQNDSSETLRAPLFIEITSPVTVLNADGVLAASGNAVFVIETDIAPGESISRTLEVQGRPRFILTHNTLVNAPPPSVVDLEPTELDLSAVTVDPQLLLISGQAQVRLQNNGSTDSADNHVLMLFEDMNFDGQFQAETDHILGGTLANIPAPGSSISVNIDIDAGVLFANNLIYAFADSSQQIDETDESNNVVSSVATCESPAPIGSFDPQVEFAWTTSPTQPDSLNVISTPAVADINGDTIPDLVFVSTGSRSGIQAALFGSLRAIDGRDGSELFTGPELGVHAAGSVAVGDIDNDGEPEIIAVRSANRLRAHESDGTSKWISEPLDFVGFGAPAIADIDQDGTPEIISANQVLNNDGSIRWTGTGGSGQGIALAADIDIDGQVDVVAGNTAYNNDGSTKWQALDVPDGFTAVGQFDTDPEAEVIVSAGGEVFVLEHDGTIKFGPLLLPDDSGLAASSGPPTVADFDGDGAAEIGVAGRSRYVVFETDGSLRWAVPITDNTSGFTGSSVFDFEGDGAAEVVYSDETQFYIFSGLSGDTLFSTELASGTLTEYPVIADVDADGNAEIIVVANNNLDVDDARGVFVFGDANDTWVNARQVWNQHTYHITNVEDDLSIPTVEANSWQTANTYRAQAAIDVLACTDVSASLLRADFASCPSEVALTARVGNGGALVVAAGTPVAFYDGDPLSSDSNLIATTPLEFDLFPGNFADVEALWINPPAGAATLFAVVDDDGNGGGQIREIDEANNSTQTSVDVCRPPIVLPQANAGVDQRVAEGATVNLTGATSQTSGAVSYNWTLVAQPVGSTAVLSNSTSASPFFTADLIGTYIVELQVSDDNGTSLPDLVVIEANATVAVSSLRGLSLSDAVDLIAALGLELGNVSFANDATIAPDAVISQTPTPGTAAVLGAQVDLVVSQGPAIPGGGAPQVEILIERDPLSLGETTTVTVVASDDEAVIEQSLIINGVAVALDGNAQTLFTGASAGLVQLLASAADANGNVTETRASLRVIDPSDNARPQVAIDAPIANTTVSHLADVVGTVSGPDVERYQVDFARADQVDLSNPAGADPDWLPLGSGSGPITAEVIGQLDATVLANDNYVLRLLANDTSNNVAVTVQPFSVVGATKIGSFDFEATDLAIPLAGIPVEVIRRYNTLDAGEAADFGFGWRLAQADPDFSETIPVTAGEAERPFPPISAPFQEGTRVYLTDPDGRRVGFTFAPQPTTTIFGEAFIPRFVADPGVFDQLNVPGDVDDNQPIMLQRLSDGTFVQLFIPFPYNPREYTLTRTDGLQYEYDQFDGLQRIVDDNGNTVTFSDTGIIHSSGVGITFERDGSGRVTRIEDPDGNAIHYAYDSAGDLVSVIDQAGLTTRYGYSDLPNLAHYLDEVIDPLGRATATYQYDEDGRVLAVTDAVGVRTERLWDVDGFRGTFIDGNGEVTEFEYDARGNIVRAIDPLGGEQFNTYDVDDNLLSRTDENGNTVTFAYDDRGNLVAMTDPLGATQTFAFDADNNLVEQQNALGAITQLTYDNAGNLTQIRNAVGDTLSAAYDANGRPLQITDLNGGITSFEYDERGFPVRVTNASGSTAVNEYDGIGGRTRQIDEEGGETTFVFDPSGRVLSTTDPEGNTETVSYIGHLVAARTDALGNTTRFEYDDADRVIAEIDANGGTTRFAYDAAGNRIEVTDTIGQTTRFTYDALNRVIERIDAAGNVTAFEYDGVGNTTAIVDRNGRRRVFEYDANNQLLREIWLNGNDVVRTIEMRYDAVGRVTELIDPDGSYQLSYDVLGRISVLDNAGSITPRTTLSYSRDAIGNTLSVADSNGVSVDSAYDSLFRLTSRTWQGPGITAARADFSYPECLCDRIAGIGRFMDLAGFDPVIASSIEYDATGEPTRIEHAAAATYDYTYNGLRNVVREVRNGTTTDFEYDALEQVVERRVDGLVEETFVYDAHGNPAGSGNTTAADNRLVITPRFDLSYDGEGNLIEKLDRASGERMLLSYDHRNRLNRVLTEDAAGIQIATSSYRYDALNARIEVNVDGVITHTVYDEIGHAWADFDANGVTTRYLFGPGIDQVMARQSATGETAWHLVDHLNSVRELVNEDGDVIQEISYSTFGAVASDSEPSVGDRFRFTGRELDATGLYYYRARYYDPQLGRFISQDPLGFAAGDTNLYRYVGNNPVNFLDPTGLTVAVQEAKLAVAVSARILGITAIINCAYQISTGEDGLVLSLSPVTPCAVISPIISALTGGFDELVDALGPG